MPRHSLHRISGAIAAGVLLACSSAEVEPGLARRPTGSQPIPAADFLEVEAHPAHPGLTESLLPPSQDLSPYFPPPGDQGDRNTCVAWAGAYGLLTYLKNRSEGQLPRAGEQVYPERWFSPEGLYARLHKDAQGQTSMLEALKLLAREGCAPYPYHPPGGARDSQADRIASRYRLRSFRRVDPTDRVELKLHLYEGSPILIGLPVDAAWMRLSPGQVWPGPRDPVGHHAMILVGYDDRREAFRVMNSWGEVWADEGFGWMGYAAVEQHADHAFVAVDRPHLETLGTWHNHGHVMDRVGGGWSHLGWDAELEVEDQQDELTGTFRVASSWLRLGSGDAIEALVSRELVYEVRGKLTRGVAHATGRPVRIQTRAWRRDVAGPIVYAARHDGRRFEMAGPVVPGADVRWRAARLDEWKRILAPITRGLSGKPLEWVPMVGEALTSLELIGRESGFGEQFGLVLKNLHGTDLLLKMSRAAEAGEQHLHGVAGHQDLFWNDHGRGALRRVRTTAPGDPSSAGRLPALPPEGEGLPLFAPVELVRVDGVLWMLDTGLRRRMSRGAAERLGLDLGAVRALTPAELGTYPEGPALE